SITKERVDISLLAGAVLEDLKRGQGNRSIEIQVRDLPDGLGDEALLKQVLVNLLSNAFKFTRHREQASIEIGGQAEGPENIYFVRDNGDGFDMQHAGRLFQPFQRLHSKDEFEGTGVGLSLVHRIVRLHGGRIWAEAEAGKGAAFFFTLPATTC